MAIDRLSIEELGLEYEKYAKLQQYFIQKCSADIKRAEESGDFRAEEDLKIKLRKFREIKYELLETSKQLKNYYKGEI